MAEQIDVLYESALTSPHGLSHTTLTEDRDAIFAAKTLPGVDGINPLRDVLDWDRAGHPRRSCCVCYVIPDRYGPGLDSDKPGSAPSPKITA